MARNYRGKGGFKRLSGVDVGRVAVKVYMCRGCEAQHAPGSKPTQCLACGRMDFSVFDSKGEGERWAQLRLMEKARMISGLERQVRFPLMAWNEEKRLAVKVGEYWADFVYMRDGERVIEDFKGGLTDLASWKLRHMTAQGMPVKLTSSIG